MAAEKKKYVGGLVATLLGVVFTLVGCSTGTTYKYSNQDTTAPIVISKAVYTDNELKLYIKGQIGDCDVTAFDRDFKVIDEDFTTSYSGGVFSIKGEHAGLISGLYMDGYCRYHMRYLDSDEYAILYEYDVTEIGWETYGDTEKYYTEEELASQQAKNDEETALQKANYELIEGTWICERDSSVYIKIYESEYGKKIEWNMGSDGDYYLNDMYIAVIYINDSYLGKEVVLLEDEYWGNSMRFYMSEDMTQIMDPYNDGYDIYIKEAGE